MWVTTPTLLPLIPPPQTATVTRRRHSFTTVAAAAAAPKDVTGLGQAILGALKSSPSPKSDPKKSVKPEGRRKKEGGEENSGKELNGSDILWALQKASAKKARVSVNNSKKKVQNNGNGSNGSGLRVTREDANRVVDYDNVRPIVVKSDWVTRLDDLEKRLKEFSII